MTKLKKQKPKSSICSHYQLIQFTSFQFIDECVIQETKRLTTFANWELLVPRLTKYRHSHIIIQNLNINSLHIHYQNFQHDHNLQTSHILCLQKQRIAKTFHFGTTKYNHILYIFNDHDNIMMYDNNVILQLYKTMTHTKSKHIAAPFNPNTKKAFEAGASD